MYKPVFCISQDIGQTATIVNNLKTAGFSNNEISLLFPDIRKTQEAPGGQTDSETADRLDLEWIARIGRLKIPGVGQVIAAGPIMVELSRIPEKGSSENLISALIGIGIPEHETKHYQEKIKAGGALIAVNTASVEARDTANAIFRQAQAKDISSSEETSVIG